MVGSTTSSITRHSPRKGALRLKMGRNKTGLLIFVLIVTVHWAAALRTTRERSRESGNPHHGVVVAAARRSPLTFAHPTTAKESRRLSFLNHQLSLLGGKVGPESRISSKIYSHSVDQETGTDEISVVEVPQNSDVVVGKDVPKANRLVLECQADFPVTWSYKGDGAPVLQTNTTTPAGKKGKYSAIAMIGKDDGTVEGKETGEYICQSTENPEESIRYYLFVPGRSYFIRRGGIIRLSPTDNVLRIPCSVANPEARVTILKSNKGYLQCVVNDTLSYGIKSGFTLRLVEDDEANDPAGSYVCMAGINNQYQLAEYTVIRSFENSTYEYNWDENGGVIYDDNLSISDLGRNENVCDPNPCGKNSVCDSVPNVRTGDPFTCSCQEGFVGKPPRCRGTSLCDPGHNPCGPHSVCTENPDRNYPKCACKPTYIGRPPNCQPECVLDDDCHASFSCVNNTCQNPCLRACSLDAVCTVQKHKARCSCPMGTAGDPSNGGRCHKIRLPSLQFFPFFGLRPRPRPPPRPPVRLQEEPQPQQIFPGDSLLSAAVDLFSGSVEDYSSAESRNPCEPWPCGPYSQCTPVGEFAHCKCNIGYVGLPPNCKPECRRDEDCSSSHACVDNNCKSPCNSGRGKVRCGAGAQCRGRNHEAECHCPSGYRGDPMIRCTPADSSESGSGSQESGSGSGMWGSSHRPPPSSGSNEQSYEENSSHSGSGSNKNPGGRPGMRPGQSQRPPRPTNPQRPPPSEDRPGGGSGGNGGNNNDDESCANFCGKNSDCVQRNNTVTCRCKPGYTGPGSDPYTECHPSRNPCSKCGPNSVCRVMGNGQAVCECQPGKLGSPPNCRENACRYNQDCPSDQACYRRNCIDPCSRAKCGQYATCKAINHYAVCACPNDPDKDPLEDGGCPPPPNSSDRRKQQPGFFPPTRFFI